MVWWLSQTGPNTAFADATNLVSQIASVAGAVGGGLSLTGKLSRLAGPLGGPAVAAIGSTADVLNPDCSAAMTALNAFYKKYRRLKSGNESALKNPQVEIFQTFKGTFQVSGTPER